MQSILCFGDSITFGTGNNGGWVGKLKEELEREENHTAIFNLGICGEDSVGLLKRFDVESGARTRILWPSDKHLILIAIGINDSKWKGMPEDGDPVITLESFRKNINDLIKKAKKYDKTKLAFIGLTPVDEKLTLPYENTSFKNERVEKFNNIIKECTNDEDLPFLNFFDIMVEEDYLKFLNDGLHINSKGYDFMHKFIMKFIEDNKLLD